MKKIISVLCSVILILCIFSGCGTKTKNTNADNRPNTADSEKIKVVTTIFPPYDFARQIIGDAQNVELKMLVSPGIETHGFEATLDDINTIKNADLFIYNGGESEEWVDDVFESIGDASVKKIAMTAVSETLEEVTVEGMESIDDEHDHAHTDEDEFDEHVWTSPENAMRITEAICTALCEVDPDHAEDYKSNKRQYMNELSELDNEFKDIASKAARKTVVFAERFPFRYLAQELGLNYYAAFKGCSSSTEPSLSTINFLIHKIKDHNIPVVFYIEFSTQTVADQICKATGAKKLLLHSCHNVSQEDFKNNVTYVQLMKQNAENLRTALS